MRHLMTLMLTGLLIFTSSVTLSQEMPYLYCGDLPEADCQLLNNGFISLPNLHSAQIDLSAQMWQGDAQPIDYMQISGFLNGTVNLEMFQSSVGYYEFLRDMDAELTFTAPRSLEADLDERIGVNFMLLDNIFYIDLDGLQPFLNDPTLPAWGCYDLSADLDAEIEERMARAEAEEPVEPFATGLDANVLIEVLGADFTGQFIQVTRTDTNGTALFETRVDLAGLYNNPTFRDVFRERMLEQEGPRPLTAITDAQLDQLQTVVAALFPEPMVITGLGIDLETGFLSSVYTWRPDEWIYTVSAVLRGEDTTGSTVSAFTITLNLSDFNTERIIAAPEGAEPFEVNILREVEPVLSVLPLSSGVRDSSPSC